MNNEKSGEEKRQAQIDEINLQQLYSYEEVSKSEQKAFDRGVWFGFILGLVSGIFIFKVLIPLLEQISKP